MSETEPLAEISAAPMSKLSRLRTNLLEDKMAILEDKMEFSAIRRPKIGKKSKFSKLAR